MYICYIDTQADRLITAIYHDYIFFSQIYFILIVILDEVNEIKMQLKVQTYQLQYI